MRISAFFLTCLLLILNFSTVEAQTSKNNKRKLKPATGLVRDSISNYKFFYITPTNSLTSSTGSTINGIYISSSKSVNPSDVITGILIKQGLIRLPELKPEINDQTLLINYGESGRRNNFLGYTIEVTIQLISAKTNELACNCTAEGQGSTEADDIRIAISRCMNEIIPKK
jgi:hypothetical protein